MINDDLNLYFSMKKGKIVVNRFHIEEKIEYSLIKAFTTQSDSSFAELNVNTGNNEIYSKRKIR